LRREKDKSQGGSKVRVRDRRTGREVKAFMRQETPLADLVFLMRSLAANSYTC
ncbi:hypothetical protein CSUI_009458, partial [Cystoisospora suis]